VTDQLAPPASTPYLVAVAAGAMAFLAVCALTAGQSAARLAGFWEGDLSGTATVRLTEEADADAALSVLADRQGVLAARRLDDEEVAALMLPWIGELPEPDLLPLPQIIDIRLAPEPPDPVAMQSALEDAVPGAVYDDHRAWAAPLRRTAQAFQRLIAGAVGLSGIALAAMVAVAARASLASAAVTVRTLRLLGARDGFIASTFDRGIGLRALLGAAVGAVAGAVTIPALPLETLGLEAPVAAPALPWAVVIAVPLAAGSLAWLTARVAILLMLRRAP
jgi:cell division transport system permease protein